MENMSTTSEIAKNVLAIADAIRATAYSIDPWGTDPNINASLLRAAAARLDEMERENARLRAALMYSHGAIDFYEKVQAASQDEKIAVGQDHWNWLIEAARRARAALAGSEKP
jgi:hypothetical protein